MDKYIDVIKRALELSSTIVEGFEYIQNNKEKSQDIVNVLKDIINSVYSIDKSLTPIYEKIPFNNLEVLMNDLKNIFEYITTEYNTNAGLDITSIVQLKLMPAYKKWHEELNRVLTPYVLS